MKSYRDVIVIACVSLLLLAVTGCHTVHPARVADPTKLKDKKHLHVVQSTGKERGFHKEIVRNLTARGFIVASGKLEAMDAKAELYLSCEDRWTWDMVMYPWEVKMALHDARTRELLGSSHFKNTFFHTYPDPPEITDELLGRIFGEPEGRYMK
ncbi:MAG: hypothetical protein WCS99_03165 [Limisphaerales bacterium]